MASRPRARVLCRPETTISAERHGPAPPGQSPCRANLAAKVVNFPLWLIHRWTYANEHHWRSAFLARLSRAFLCHACHRIMLRVDHADAGNRALLLRPCHHRPRRCHTAEKRDELAARGHSITSSARPSRASGMVSPSRLAVLRLMINSTLLDCSTGNVVGFSPFRMRPAYLPSFR